MLNFLPRPLRACIMFLLFVVNLLAWAVPVYALILIKILMPTAALRGRMTRLMSALAQRWAATNVLIGDFMLGTEWDIQGVDRLDLGGQYLVTSNHQTWNDIYVLMKTFGRRAPFFKFFLKKELKWVPILGPVWWALDYPFMHRHSKEAIAANPQLATQDLETTRLACERYRGHPVMILNFLEGTRFTAAKHARQQSPYTHLLRPKTGGLIFALQAIGEKMSSILDVTIVYPEGACGFWEFFGGRMRHVTVRVREVAIPAEFYHGDYAEDAEFRARVQAWVSNLWEEKDALVEGLRAEAAVS